MWLDHFQCQWELWLYYCLNKTGTVVESIAETSTAVCGLDRINTCHILNAFRLLKGKGHWSQQLMLVFLSNLLVTWMWGLDWTNRSTVGQEAGRAWAWPEVSGLALAGASLEIMLPSCNTVWQWLTLCSHLNRAILGCYTLKQWDWESGDEWFPCPGPQEARERSSDLPLPADSPIGSSSAEHHVTFYWSTPCGWLGQFFFFSWAKAGFYL